MNKLKLKTFDTHLAEELKDPEFAEMYYKERERFVKKYEIVTKQYAEKEIKIRADILV